MKMGILGSARRLSLLTISAVLAGASAALAEETVLPPPNAPAGEMRTWTSVTGETLEAK